MTLIIYGSPRSRTLRTLWVATELGLDFEHRPLAWDDPVLKTAAFLELNPAGTIPVIVDDGLTVAESLAINLHLARKYGRQGAEPLYPNSEGAQTEVWRWSLWAQGELEPWIQQDARTAQLRAAAPAALAALVAASLTVLDRVLASRRWLVADHFTVGDLNVAAVLSPSRARTVDLRAHPHVEAWLAACYDRPAARAVRARFPG